MTRLLAIDPGSEVSGWCVLDGRQIADKGITRNSELQWQFGNLGAELCVMEIQPPYVRFTLDKRPYVPKQLATTYENVGRFEMAWELLGPGGEFVRITRQKVLATIAWQYSKPGDSQARAALIDMYGGKDSAIGKKANPGPLYGVSSHVWSALALGITYQELKRLRKI